MYVIVKSPNRIAKPETITKHKMYQQNGIWYSQVIENHKKNINIKIIFIKNKKYTTTMWEL
jgi:hypothetical protein